MLIAGVDSIKEVILFPTLRPEQDGPMPDPLDPVIEEDEA